MANDNDLERITDCVVNLRYDEIKEACEAALDAGIPAHKAVEAMGDGMTSMGEKYEAGEYFLSELIVSGEVMKEGMKALQPHLKAGDTKKKGRVVIGTVKGDLHDIGKNVVSVMLGAAGFDVVDLGIDVSADSFVEAVRENKPDILGMSALLTVTMPEMELVIDALKKARLREKVNVILGGAPITSEYAKKIGADDAASDAVYGVRICNSWVKA